MSTQVHQNLPENPDPYTEKASNNDLNPQQKIDGLKEILKVTTYGMLTTRNAQGHLHSRAMALGSHASLHFSFLTNLASHKVEELNADSNVNVSFFDPSTTNWVSVAGTAKIVSDKEVVKKLWHPSVAAYFDDKKDGVHTGSADDPRVGVIEVTPDEIQYWYVTKGKVSRAVGAAAGAVTGHTTAPGELRLITREEIQLVEGLHKA
ncbi:hypothetical protein BOTBODRAFT_150590 [Botryobasidium botryosum FD-172 SS1]|uniref:General stress protein FMN-binding split barrel domain-containing protein n=1 Tax=Botryobasidium botryosum (strain FD-172 SS1) TaxID=930990 RepID=A0A067NCZ5_BOTB1|nr:hypothetical protein BOTBODRAFT_150590 [Botryobasidium botryosum FD-172 SS1]